MRSKRNQKLLFRILLTITFLCYITLSESRARDKNERRRDRVIQAQAIVITTVTPRAVRNPFNNKDRNSNSNNDYVSRGGNSAYSSGENNNAYKADDSGSDSNSDTAVDFPNNDNNNDADNIDQSNGSDTDGNHDESSNHNSRQRTHSSISSFSTFGKKGYVSSYGSGSYANLYASSSIQSDTSYFCARERNMDLMCYCAPETNRKEVENSECWVFADLSINHTAWKRFNNQKDLRQLKFVVQNSGRLTFIPTMVMEPLLNLSLLTIEFANLGAVEQNSLVHLTQLSEIHYHHDRITRLGRDAFSNYLQLRLLNLEHNEIYDIHRMAFRNLPACRQLNLSFNRIAIVPEGVFAEMPRLEYISLDHNHISMLTSEMFKGLGSLKVLVLTYNRLNFVGDMVFTELWSMVELYIDNNFIEELSERALDGLNNLEFLSAGNNRLITLDPGLLRATPAMHFIKLFKNIMETLDQQTFQPIMDNLLQGPSDIMAAENDFICDCRLEWLFEARNRTHSEFFQKTLDEFICELIEPKLSDFLEPVPDDIYELLIEGGYITDTTTTTTTTTHAYDSVVNGRKRVAKPRQSQMQRTKMQLTDNKEFDVIEKRSIAAELTGESSDDTAISASFYADVGDYQDDTAVQSSIVSANQFESPDEDPINNYVARTTTQPTTTTFIPITRRPTTDIPRKKGIKVHLMLLKPNNLQCKSATVDPTELPLSRDLMGIPNSSQCNSSYKLIKLITITVYYFAKYVR